MPATTPAARPLDRLGSYRLEEKPGTNPTPENAMPPEALREYWVRIVRSVVGQSARRDRAAKELDASIKRRDGSFSSVVRSRYSSKIEIKTCESVIALLHEIIAPEAEFLCDEMCPHVAASATPDQIKRYLDSLDAAIAWATEQHKGTHYDHPRFDDLLDERSVYRLWRVAFIGMFERATGEWLDVELPGVTRE